MAASDLNQRSVFRCRRRLRTLDRTNDSLGPLSRQVDPNPSDAKSPSLERREAIVSSPEPSSVLPRIVSLVLSCVLRMAFALTLTGLAATGCCLVTPQEGVGDAAPGDIVAAEAIPILVTLTANEGESLAAARERVLARLRSAMSAGPFSTVRSYETLPIVALAATPEVVAVLLTLPDVRSIEADRSFESSLGRSGTHSRTAKGPVPDVPLTP